MRVFVTGATGFIGQAVVQDLLAHGHQVLGLVRSTSGSEALRKSGAEAHQGDLEDLEGLRSAARASDGVIHLAFVHDFNDFARATRIDRAAIQALGDAVAGTDKALVIASGTLGVARDQLATEDSVPAPSDDPLSVRFRAEDLLRSLSREKGVRGSVVRLAPVVHGTQDWGFVPMLVGLARKNGVAIQVDGGEARWPAVHKVDAAALFRLALESAACGATYHAVVEQGVPIRDIMAVIARRLQIPVASKPLADAVEAMGMMAHLVSTDAPTSSEQTQKALGWKPSQVGLLADMEENYFS